MVNYLTFSNRDAALTYASVHGGLVHQCNGTGWQVQLVSDAMTY